MKCKMQTQFFKSKHIEDLYTGQTFSFPSIDDTSLESCIYMKIFTPPNCSKKLYYAVRLLDGFILSIEFGTECVVLEECNEIEFKIKDA